MAEEISKLAKISALNRVFTPSAPVVKRSGFAGRHAQIMRIVGAVNQPGRHIVLYGERGVGKTSLANILAELLVPVKAGFQDYAVRINCAADSTFFSVWEQVAIELGVEVPESWIGRDPGPDEVRRFLAAVEPPMVIVVDEYDRIEDDVALSLMADTLKALSDHLVESKLVLVGVSDSIEQLIGEHESVRRAIEEVSMPRMTAREIAELVVVGFQVVRMYIEPAALARIARLAEGLPTYAHALALAAGTRSAQDDRSKVTLGDVEHAAKDLVRSPHSATAAYYTAIQSPRPENQFAQVLAACALATKDDLGYFTPASVKEPLSRIMGRPYDIPAFSRHLSEFMKVERGSVLQRRGEPRRYRYRFRDPMMQPYAIMAALAAGLFSDVVEKELFQHNQEVDWDSLVEELGTASPS